MTAVVGVLCRDGVVIGTDSSATFTQYVGPGTLSRTIEQRIDKLDVLADRIVVAGTGAIGLGQRFCGVVKDAWQKRVFTKTEMDVCMHLSTKMIDNMRATHLKPGQYGALVAFPANKALHLCEFQLVDFQPELKTERLWYCSIGSTQPITDPFLALMREFFWQDGLPSLHEGVFAATWSLDHAIKVNPGGVNGPVQIATLERTTGGSPRVRRFDDDDLQEHRQSIEDAKELLRDYRKKHATPDLQDVPDVPQP